MMTAEEARKLSAQNDRTEEIINENTLQMIEDCQKAIYAACMEGATIVSVRCPQRFDYLKVDRHLRGLKYWCKATHNLKGQRLLISWRDPPPDC